MLARVARQLRERQGWSKARAARELAISLSSYKRLEQGIHMPDGAELRRMAVVYRVDANLLLHGVALTGDETTPAEQSTASLRQVFNRFVALERQQQAAVVQLVGDLYELAQARGGKAEEEVAATLRARLEYVLDLLERGED